MNGSREPGSSPMAYDHLQGTIYLCTKIYQNHHSDLDVKTKQMNKQFHSLIYGIRTRTVYSTNPIFIATFYGYVNASV